VNPGRSKTEMLEFLAMVAMTTSMKKFNVVPGLRPQIRGSAWWTMTIDLLEEVEEVGKEESPPRVALETRSESKDEMVVIGKDCEL